VRLGLTEEQHAQLLGVDITEKNWRMMAGNFARREYIFEGDKLIYDTARHASDDFEHGKADLGGVRQAADSVTRDLFDLVRSAILSVVPSLDQAISTRSCPRARWTSPRCTAGNRLIVSEEPLTR